MENASIRRLLNSNSSIRHSPTVINRGQRDISQRKSIKEGLRKEMEFFKSHPAYRSLQHRCGTTTLAKMLNSILMHHIRDCLPEIKNRITGMMADIQQELDALGTPTGDISRATLGGSLLGLLSKFAASFGNAVDGKGSSADGVEMNELYGGARISYIFNEVRNAARGGAKRRSEYRSSTITTTLF